MKELNFFEELNTATNLDSGESKLTLKTILYIYIYIYIFVFLLNIAL